MNRILALLGKNDFELANCPGGSKPGGDDRTISTWVEADLFFAERLTCFRGKQKGKKYRNNIWLIQKKIPFPGTF